MKLRIKLLRWHSRMGLVSAVFVILLSITGILLNHGNSLSLDKKPLSNSLLQLLYNIEAPSIRHFSASGITVSQVNETDLYLNALSIGRCEGELVGAVAQERFVLIGCETELLLFSQEGELIDKLNSVNDLPLPIDQMGLCQISPCWQSDEQVFTLDIETMNWQESGNALVQTFITAEPNLEEKEALLAKGRSEITWERVIQDLHSGRLLGSFGPWLMDAMAVLFVIIAATGIVIWTVGKKRRENGSP